jgi:hypothetical protein
MCSKKWYLKRNISCDAHLLNELIETDVPWDDAVVVSAGKLRKLWRFPERTAQFCAWKTTRKDNSEACAIAFQNCAVYSVFPPGMSSHSKISQFNCECIGRLKSQYVFAVLASNEVVFWVYSCGGVLRRCVSVGTDAACAVAVSFVAGCVWRFAVRSWTHERTGLLKVTLVKAVACTMRGLYFLLTKFRNSKLAHRLSRVRVEVLDRLF